MPSSKVSTIPNFTFQQYGLVDGELKKITDPNKGGLNDFPFLYKSDGKPFDLANAYLTHDAKSKWLAGSYNSTTYKTKANDLIDYERFLSDRGLDPLDFHTKEENRPTYLYRQYLIERTKLRKKDPGYISRATANKKIGTVVQFYTGLAKHGLIPQEAFDRSHVPKKVILQTYTDTGFQKSMTVKSSDLAIKKGAKAERHDVIIDGGALRPLSEEEQRILMRAVEASDNYTMQLMFEVALFTGARIQTVGTLSLAAIRSAAEESGSYCIEVGPGTGVDTKGDKELKIRIPRALYQKIETYIDSPDAHARRENSFYGESIENYVFLSNQSLPFYTAKREMARRATKEGLSRLNSLKDRISFRVTLGDSVRKYIERLLPKIRETHPDFKSFSFHDLRATCGMNELKIWSEFAAERSKDPTKPQITTTEILDAVRRRLGHSKIETSMGYLQFKERAGINAAINSAYEKKSAQMGSDA